MRKGKIFQLKEGLLDEDNLKELEILTCQSYPLSKTAAIDCGMLGRRLWPAAFAKTFPSRKFSQDACGKTFDSRWQRLWLKLSKKNISQPRVQPRRFCKNICPPGA